MTYKRDQRRKKIRRENAKKSKPKSLTTSDLIGLWSHKK